MSTTDFPMLEMLFGTYFHEDWRHDDPDVDAVLQRFLGDVSYSELETTVSELIRLLEQNMDDRALAWFMQWKLQGTYDPSPEQSNREWLKGIVHVFREELKKRGIA